MQHSKSPLKEKLREFWPILAITTLVMLVVSVSGVLFFLRGRQIMQDQLKDKLRSTATAAAMQFDGESVDRIRAGDTMKTSTELRKTVAKLQSLRENIANIRYVYIMRKTKEPSVLAFVADADLALTTEQLDENNNGIIEPNEEVPLPGALYDGEVIPALTQDAFLHPVTDSNITIDQWGSTISGYAPILNKTGQAVAVLGIDMDATEYINLSESIFSPVGLLLVLLAGVSVGGSILLFLWKRRLEALERLEIERSGLLRLAFHQLGGPLTIINWSLEELQEEGPRSLHRTIDNIQEGVKRLGKILRTLKEADLVHTGHIEYHPESVSLTSILQKVAADAADQLAARSQNIQLALAGDITTNLDPKLIAGVVQELLTNAIDFSPDGATIVMRSRKILGRAEFEIEDHGCGIPRRDLERLFNEFTRGSNANRYKADGNGLGLYIVRGIIRRAGGTVSIQSMEGHGTTVTVRLPMA